MARSLMEVIVRGTRCLSGARRPACCPVEVRVLEGRTMPSISVQIDYSYDSLHFFDSQAKRDVMQLAANTIASTLNDNLLAIQPSGNNSWSATFPDPSTGQGVTINNLAVPANTLIVYVGGRPLSGNAGEGGPGGWRTGGGGGQAWTDLVRARGQAGALSATPTDFGPWGGAITFDTSGSTNWYFGQAAGGLSSQQLDFFSIAEHEVGHVLGIGANSSWRTYVSGNTFTGPAAQAAFGGRPVPLDPSGGHWAPGTKSDGVDPVMVPALLAGQRRTFTTLDKAGLKDIGWSLGASNNPPVVVPPAPRIVSAGTLLTFTVAASDKETPANRLTFSLVNPPAGAVIDPKTGVFSWTPTGADARQHVFQITVQVTDDGKPALSDAKSFTVTVNEAGSSNLNAPPVLAALSPRTVVTGKTLRFTATATDRETPAGQLAFSLVGAPSGAMIDSSTGVFSWTPTAAQGGRRYTMSVKVTDGGSPRLSDTETLAVTVQTQPRVVKVTTSRGSQGTTTITVFFNQAMNPKTAALATNYYLLTSKVAGGPPTIRAGLTARYDARNNSVTLTLSMPKKYALQLTVSEGVSAASGLKLGKKHTVRVQ